MNGTCDPLPATAVSKNGNETVVPPVVGLGCGLLDALTVRVAEADVVALAVAVTEAVNDWAAQCGSSSDKMTTAANQLAIVGMRFCLLRCPNKQKAECFAMESPQS